MNRVCSGVNVPPRAGGRRDERDQTPELRAPPGGFTAAGHGGMGRYHRPASLSPARKSRTPGSASLTGLRPLTRSRSDFRFGRARRVSGVGPQCCAQAAAISNPMRNPDRPSFSGESHN